MAPSHEDQQNQLEKLLKVTINKMQPPPKMAYVSVNNAERSCDKLRRIFVLTFLSDMQYHLPFAMSFFTLFGLSYKVCAHPIDFFFSQVAAEQNDALH